MPRKPSLPRLGLWIVCAGLVLTAGCQEQESIRHYVAPKESMPEPARVRMLAVMVPRDKEVWFFKLMGPEKAVREQVDTFDRFVASVHFFGIGSARYDATLQGWQELPGKLLPGNGQIVARWRLEGVGSPLELSVTKLGPEAADVRQNVDRWRGQLALPPVTDKEFRKLRDNIEVDGVKATRVDLIAIRGVAAAQPPMGRAKKTRLPFRYTRPDGWEVQPPDVKKGVSRPLVLRVAEGGREAELSALSLPGDGGGLLANVVRWRRQLGMGPATEAEVRKDLHTLRVAGVEAPYVDLVGAGPGTPQRTLGAVLRHGDATWFFTLKGPADLVGKQQSAFEAFVQSIRFDGDQGAAHE
jgi:hypothetical protein